MTLEADVASALGASIGSPLQLPAALGQEPISVPRYTATLRQVVEGTRTAAFGKRSAARIDDGAGFPTFAELLVSTRLRVAGWECAWACVYGGMRFVESWAWNASNPSLVTLPSDVLEVLKRIAATRQSIIGGRKASFGGIPDVIAWRGSDLVMIECKRQKEDCLRRTQLEWLHSAALIGIKLEQLGVFEWSYS